MTEATPAEMVTSMSAPGRSASTSAIEAATAARMRSATTTAAALSAPGAMTTNSSPP